MKQMHRVLVAILLCCIFTPYTVFAQNNADIEKMNDIKNKIEKYIGTKETGEPYFLRTEAINDGITEEYIEVGETVYYIMNEYYLYEKGISTYATMPIYGRWCGPGYGEGNGTPIDLLDTGCKEHDMCYKNIGYHKCSCDVKLVSYIDRNIGKMKGTEKKVAAAIRTWASIKSSKVTKNGGNTSCRV